MDTILLAYYFSALVAGRDYPVVIGPYASWDECASVREWVDRKFQLETAGCGLLPFPQYESVLMQVFDVPPSFS